MTNHPDHLRSPENIFDPDPRSAGFEVLGEKGFRPKTRQDQHDAVAEISLHDGVPREIVIEFETAKSSLRLASEIINQIFPRPL